MSALPPVKLSVVVPLEMNAAFHLFVFRLADWWPLATRSVQLTGAVSCRAEPHLGGRVFERGADGREEVWGKILVWDEPRRVAFSWHPGIPEESATEVDVTFTSLGGSTRVELEHRNWERLGERAAFVRGLFESESGWPGVLRRFVELASGATDLPPVVGPGCLDSHR